MSEQPKQNREDRTSSDSASGGVTEIHVRQDIGSLGPGGTAVGVLQGDYVSGDKVVYEGLTAEQVAALFVRIKREDQPAVWNGTIPYPGLRAFQESDARYFFGRESLVKELLEKVTASRFITIAGPSGSGKSSVARAGLLHALREGKIDGSEAWLLATMSPHGDPLGNLAMAMQRAARAEAIGEKIKGADGQNPGLLADAIEMYLTDDERQRCLLLVDQFEEIFTQTTDPAIQKRFVDLLTGAVEGESSRMIIVLSMRSDFISHCARFPALRGLMSRQFQLVGAMEPNDLAKAISLPALEVGAEIEAALVSRILEDMQGEPGALPLMSFALHDLFEAEKTAPGERMDLTLQEYLDRGGLEKALERHANRVFGNFSAEQQALAEKVFARLIMVGSGTVTRRTATLAELAPAGEADAEVLTVVQALADTKVRLLTTTGATNGEDAAEAAVGAATVTIAHERLIEAWPWLHQLVEENREIIRMRSQIAEAAVEWDTKGRDAGYLYTGARLAAVEEQQAEAPLALDSRSEAFIAASVGRRKAARRRSRMAMGVLVMITLTAVLAAVLAIRATNQATARRMAVDARLAAEEGRMRLATLLAIEAARREPSDAVQIWSDLYSYAPQRFYMESAILTGHEGGVLSVAWDSKGERLASASGDGTVRLWDSATGRELAVLTGHRDRVYSVDWDAAGERLASGSADGTVRIWDAASGSELAMLSGHGGPVNGVAWDVSGERLASASDDGTVRIWDAATGRELAVLMGSKDWTYSVAWDPQGERLASGSCVGRDLRGVCVLGEVAIWDAASGTQLAVLKGNEGGVSSVAWDEAGERLASASDDGTVRIWDATAWTGIDLPTDLVGSIMSVDWDKKGERLAFATSRDEVYVWDVASGTELAVLTGHGGEGIVFGVAWNGEGTRLASASDDGIVRIWDEAVGTELAVLTGHENGVRSVNWDQKGARLASASVDGTVRIWDAADGTELAVLEGHEDQVVDVSWDGEGKRVASASWDGTVRVWDAGAGRELAVLTGHEEAVYMVAWDKEGERLASASSDVTVRIWDAAAEKELSLLTRNALGVDSLTWNEEGKLLAIVGSSGKVHIWDAEAQKELAVLQGHGGPVNGAAWEWEGKRLASASYDHKVYIWDAAAGKQLAVLPAMDGGVESIAWDAEGGRLATGSSDGTVRIWDAAAGTELAVLTGHEGWISSIAWDSDGKRLATASNDRTVRIWDAAASCERIYFNLTVEEWRRYMGATLPYRPTCAELPVPKLDPVPLYEDPFLTYGRWGIVTAVALFLIWFLATGLMAAYFLARGVYRGVRSRRSAQA